MAAWKEQQMAVRSAYHSAALSVETMADLKDDSMAVQTAQLTVEHLAYRWAAWMDAYWAVPMVCKTVVNLGFYLVDSWEYY